VILIKEDAKVMADLLKSGYRMLNLSCPICNNPIFQKKNGTAFCPICNRKVLLVDHPKNSEEEETKPNLIDNTKINDVKDILMPILINKLQFIAQKLEKESQLAVISEYLEATSKILSLVEKLKNFA
jgi:uncharacterized Zn finger protein (UPF0148 family)